MNYMTELSLWIGLVNVIPMEWNRELGTAKGAFTNVIMSAQSEKNFELEINAEFYRRGYVVIDVEDIELFYDRAKKYQLKEGLIKLAEYVEQTGNIGIDRFHTYENDEYLN